MIPMLRFLLGHNIITVNLAMILGVTLPVSLDWTVIQCLWALFMFGGSHNHNKLEVYIFCAKLLFSLLAFKRVRWS